MERHRRIGLTVTVAGVCALVVAILLMPYDEDSSPATPPSAKPVISAKPLTHPPRSLDQKFIAFSTPSASLTENFKAYGWIKECLWERNFVARKVEYSPQCGLSDEYVDDLELRKQLVTRLALAGSFGAVVDIHTEGPNGLFKAFADDPKGHARLLEEAEQIGLAKGEPAVLSGEAIKLQAEGDLLGMVGASQSARSRHLKSLAYEVASIAGMAKQNGSAFAGRDDPKVQEALHEYEERLVSQDRDAALAEGERIANGWQPFCPVACQVSR
jgi:hypothetical protein